MKDFLVERADSPNWHGIRVYSVEQDTQGLAIPEEVIVLAVKQDRIKIRLAGFALKQQNIDAEELFSTNRDIRVMTEDELLNTIETFLQRNDLDYGTAVLENTSSSLADILSKNGMQLVSSSDGDEDDLPIGMYL